MAAGTVGRAADASQPPRLAAGGKLAYHRAMPEKFTHMTPAPYGYLDAHAPPARALPRAPEIDLAFIDADKESYQAYYEELLPRLRANGVLVFDNVLWMGRVIDPDERSSSTEAIRALNDAVARDERVEAVMLPVSDGITLVRKL